MLMWLLHVLVGLGGKTMFLLSIVSGRKIQNKDSHRDIQLIREKATQSYVET